MPIRNIPEITSSNPVHFLGNVAIVGCENTSENHTNFETLCKMQSEKLEYALKETGLFSNIIMKKEKADYYIFIKNSSATPYYKSISHNPGILLLSLIIPFWENYEYGYDFEIKNKDNKIFKINTLENGTHLMWSVSLLINLHPDRGLPGTFNQNEIQHLKNTIINTVM